MGEFVFYFFELLDMVSCEELFLEFLRVVVDVKEVKWVIIVFVEEEYGDKVFVILNKVDGKEKMMVFGMNFLISEVVY